ncbi:hypothetical protein MTR_7g109760 [Medicago truncatula]|uniref:Uncharacterized protein n=1 Tax=Medicago truncatula TaxID=3880 RepID=G7KTM8_MEDTR|nr:hypothetical protein MTR_7g109760 [Medicago truncatula]
MKSLQESAFRQRKQQKVSKSLTNEEHILYNLMNALVEKYSMVKEVPNIQNKGIKNVYTLKNVYLKCIFMQKVSTCNGCLEWIKKSGIFNSEVTGKQIEEILQTLVLDDEIL